MKDKLILILLGIILISATAVTTNIVTTKPTPPVDVKVISYYGLSDEQATINIKHYTSQGYTIKSSIFNVGTHQVTVFLEKY